MKLKLFVGVVMLTITGYIMNLAFYGMNLANDLTYVGGIALLAVWFIVVLPLVYKLLRRKREKAVGSTVSIDPDF